MNSINGMYSLSEYNCEYIASTLVRFHNDTNTYINAYFASSEAIDLDTFRLEIKEATKDNIRLNTYSGLNEVIEKFRVAHPLPLPVKSVFSFLQIINDCLSSYSFSYEVTSNGLLFWGKKWWERVCSFQQEIIKGNDARMLLELNHPEIPAADEFSFRNIGLLVEYSPEAEHELDFKDVIIDDPQVFSLINQSVNVHGHPINIGCYFLSEHFEPKLAVAKTEKGINRAYCSSIKCHNGYDQSDYLKFLTACYDDAVERKVNVMVFPEFSITNAGLEHLQKLLESKESTIIYVIPGSFHFLKNVNSATRFGAKDVLHENTTRFWAINHSGINQNIVLKELSTYKKLEPYKMKLKGAFYKENIFKDEGILVVLTSIGNIGIMICRDACLNFSKLHRKYYNLIDHLIIIAYNFGGEGEFFDKTKPFVEDLFTSVLYVNHQGAKNKPNGKPNASGCASFFISPLKSNTSSFKVKDRSFPVKKLNQFGNTDTSTVNGYDIHRIIYQLPLVP